MRKRLLLLALCASLLCAQTIINGGRTILGPWDASGAVSTKPAKSGTTLPETCAIGEVFFKADAAAGLNLYGCIDTNTWAVLGDGVGEPGGGEANTASNTGSAGTGLFKQKLGVDLQFYKVASADNQLTVALEGTDYLKLTISKANILGNGFVAFGGPSSTLKTFTLPNADATILTTNAAVTSAQGGTGANNTATSGRYLKGDGTNFVTSSGSASGTGACTAGQFASTLNSDAAPTCTAPSTSGYVLGAVGLTTAGRLARTSVAGTVADSTGIFEDAAGNIGIGTAVPYKQLHVYQDGAALPRIYLEGVAASSGAPGFDLAFDATNTRRSLVRASATGTLGTDLTFFTKPDSEAGVAARLTIDNAGGVTVNGLTGSGNGFACLDSTGKLYRSATACVP